MKLRGKKMIILNTEAAMVGTRIDLAVFDIFKYKEICVQSVRVIPDHLTLAEPTLAATTPIALYYNNRDKLCHSSTEAQYVIAFYHPYASHPLIIVFDQYLAITDITSEESAFEEVLEEFKIIDALSSPITLAMLTPKLFEHFPVEVDISKVDVKAVTRRHTFAMEMLTLN